jgi:hypothetical protein
MSEPAVKDKAAQPPVTQATRAGAIPPVLPLTPQTIFICFPPPAPVSCSNPFMAMGVVESPTVMANAATLTWAGASQPLMGNLSGPNGPFDWFYTFNGALPIATDITLTVQDNTGAEVRSVTFQRR